MQKFEFLLGNWNLDYFFPKSILSEAATGSGKGTIKRMFDKYVCFEYEASFSDGNARAHGIFAWDKRYNAYHYWWFEDSGNFNEASCQFIDDSALNMNWYDGVLVQSFIKKEKNTIELNMEHPKSGGGYESVLRVVMTRVSE